MAGLLLMLKTFIALFKKNPHELVNFVIVKGGTSRFFGIFRPRLKTTEKSSLYNKWLINLIVVTCKVKVVKCLKDTFSI